LESFTVPFRGRTIKIAGDRTIADWSVTAYNDTNFKLRNAFERWQNGINNMTDNEGLTNPVDYQVDAFVDHLDRNGNTIKSYTLRGAFPTVLQAIALSYDEATAIEQFDVTFDVPILRNKYYNITIKLGVPTRNPLLKVL
jgi:hypothetical protein